MGHDVPIAADPSFFPEIPSSVRLAIIIPSVRWNAAARSLIGSMVGVANEEVAVLISDNSENDEKREFLRKLRQINPNVIAVSHQKNIGGHDNFLYVFDWCKDVEFMAQIGDDDWTSPSYYEDAYRTLLDNPTATGAQTGTTFVDIGDGKFVNVSQPSMCGDSPLERMRSWNCWVARATMYNTSRRAALDSALQFFRMTPTTGITMVEDLWELGRLATGNFLSTPGHGCLIHYPGTGSAVGDQTQRFYEIFCKTRGLQYPFVFFLSLSTAIQCGLFLIGGLSPIRDPAQRLACGQYIFAHIFTTSFLPRVSSESSQAAAMTLFANSPLAQEGFKKYCSPPFTLNPVLDRALIDWFLEILRLFETPASDGSALLSARFRAFVATILENQSL